MYVGFGPVDRVHISVWTMEAYVCHSVRDINNIRYISRDNIYYATFLSPFMLYEEGKLYFV